MDKDVVDKKILITGGAGFVGSYLANKLSENNKVIVYDNLSRQPQVKLKDNIEFIEGDIRDIEKLNRVGRDIDIIFHLAAVSRVLESIDEPRRCFDVNVNATCNVVELARRLGCKLVFGSSREVYGDAQYFPVCEEHTLSPKNPYGASKLAAEIIIRSMSETYGIQSTIIRLANVYGRGDFKRVIPTYTHNIKNGNDLTIYGSPSKTIDFVHVDDVVDAFIACCNGATDNEILNIGSGRGTTLETLANMFISKDTNGRSRSSKIVYSMGNAAEVDNFIADITKAKKVLNFRNSTSLENGISELMKN